MAFRYPRGVHGRGRMSYIGSVPVLQLEGTPAEIADQVFALALAPAKRILDYPLDLLASRLRSRLLAGLLVRAIDRVARRLLANFPDHHRNELMALGVAAGDERRVIRGNTLLDLKNASPWRLLGCSSLGITTSRSTCGGPLLARNMDFFPLGYLHDYSLVAVYRGNDCRPFVSVGFPGSVGCYSGMNDAGLAVVSHEVFGIPQSVYNPNGVPFAQVVRHILETCSTVDEAESYLRAVPHTTAVSLVTCDHSAPAVFEIVPGRVVRRDTHSGAIVCTNHFRGSGLAADQPPTEFGTDQRHEYLNQVAAAGKKLGVGEMFSTIDAVNLGIMTIHSMVFEPRRLRLHVSLGPGPASAAMPTELLLEGLF